MFSWREVLTSWSGGDVKERTVDPCCWHGSGATSRQVPSLVSPLLIPFLVPRDIGTAGKQTVPPEWTETEIKEQISSGDPWQCKPSCASLSSNCFDYIFKREMAERKLTMFHVRKSLRQWIVMLFFLHWHNSWFSETQKYHFRILRILLSWNLNFHGWLQAHFFNFVLRCENGTFFAEP